MKKFDKIILLDVTTSLMWGAHNPVGIIRVESEIAKYLLKKTNNIKYDLVRFDKYNNKLIHVTNAQYEKVRLKVKPVNKLLLKLKQLKSASAAIILTLLKAIYKTLAGMRAIRSIIKKVVPIRFFHLMELCVKLTQLKAIGIRLIINRRSSKRLHSSDDRGYEFTPNKKYAIISVGLSWDHFDYELACQLKNSWDIEFIGVCYDILPITHQQYVCNLLMESLFFKHIYYLNYLFDKVSCISDFSKKEFEKLVSIEEVSSLPFLKKSR
jgi:hypothetical protein